MDHIPPTQITVTPHNTLLTAPLDTKSAAYFILSNSDCLKLAFTIQFRSVLQGIGMLFPWNAFITEENYFHFRFCGTSFEANFENW